MGVVSTACWSSWIIVPTMELQQEICLEIQLKAEAMILWRKQQLFYEGEETNEVCYWD
jgi:hypothetical protein